LILAKLIKEGDTNITTAESRRRAKAIVKAFSTLTDKDCVDVLDQLGFGVEYIPCRICGSIKKKKDYYSSPDPRIKSGVTPICKDCLKEIVYPDGKDCTKSTLIEGLSYIDRPFMNELYDRVISSRKNNISKIQPISLWGSYVESVAREKIYNKKHFYEGDNFKEKNIVQKLDPKDRSKEIQEKYTQNKRDVIRMIGYDPFANYPDETAKPMLYAQFVNFADEDARNDGMKLSAILQIVKKLNQAEKLNDHIDYLVSDSDNVDQVQKLEETSKKTIDIVNSLAKDNGISVNHNNSKSKGANTLSGKMKLIQEKGFRDIAVNSFDIDTCEGMRQVAEISNAAIRNQIGSDENVLTETLNASVQRTQELEVKCANAMEQARLLPVENLDLKEYLKEQGLLDEYNESE